MSERVRKLKRLVSDILVFNTHTFFLCSSYMRLVEDGQISKHETSD